jgi:hypothetical protein
VALWQCSALPSTWVNLSAGGSGVPLSAVTASVANTAIDNLSFTESWTWTTATTQTLLALAANALTSGDVLDVSSSSLTQTGHLAEFTSASAGAFASGAVRVNATGAHTNAAFQVDSATASGQAVAVVAPSLTTGTAIKNVSNAVTTGSLLFATTSSAAANSSAGLLHVSNTGASTTGVTARIQSSSAAGSGITVMGTGNVGIGTAGPVATLHNAGSTLNSVVPVGDKATGGDIGTAVATVDVATAFAVNQTTAGQTLTLPAPTVATAGRRVVVMNTGTQSFDLYGVTLTVPGTPQTAAASFIWTAAAWVHVQ